MLDGRSNVFLPQIGAATSISFDGELRWVAPTIGTPTTVSLVENDALLTISHLGDAVVLNSHTGEEMSWHYSFAGATAPIPPDFGLAWCGLGERGCFSPGPAAVDTDSGRFYFTAWTPGNADPELVAGQFLDGDTPRIVELWRSVITQGRRGQALVLDRDRKTVYFHGSEGQLVAANTDSGDIRWDFHLGFIPGTSPALTPSGVIVTGGAGEEKDDNDPAPIIAVEPDDNGSPRELWRRKDANSLTNVVATADGNILAALRSGKNGVELALLDGTDGSTQWSVPVPRAQGRASGLSVDSAGRVTLSMTIGEVFELQVPSD